MGHDAVGLAGERQQQPVLGRRQVNGLAGHRNALRGEVNRQVTDLDDGRAVLLDPRPAQDEDRFRNDRDLAGLDRRRVEHVGDKPRKMVALRVNRRQELGPALSVPLGIVEQQRRRVTLDRRQRRPHLVREHRDDIELQFRRLIQQAALLVGDPLARHNRRRQQIADQRQLPFGAAGRRDTTRSGVDHDRADQPVLVVHRNADLLQRAGHRRADMQIDRIDQHDLTTRLQLHMLGNHARRDLDQVPDGSGSKKRPADVEQP